jgi:hypothetical protein
MVSISSDDECHSKVKNLECSEYAKHFLGIVLNKRSELIGSAALGPAELRKQMILFCNNADIYYDFCAPDSVSIPSQAKRLFEKAFPGLEYNEILIRLGEEYETKNSSGGYGRIWLNKPNRPDKLERILCKLITERQSDNITFRKNDSKSQLIWRGGTDVRDLSQKDLDALYTDFPAMIASIKNDQGRSPTYNMCLLLTNTWILAYMTLNDRTTMSREGKRKALLVVAGKADFQARFLEEHDKLFFDTATIKAFKFFTTCSSIEAYREAIEDTTIVSELPCSWTFKAELFQETLQNLCVKSSAILSCAVNRHCNVQLDASTLSDLASVLKRASKRLLEIQAEHMSWSKERLVRFSEGERNWHRLAIHAQRLMLISIILRNVQRFDWRFGIAHFPLVTEDVEYVNRKLNLPGKGLG